MEVAAPVREGPRRSRLIDTRSPDSGSGHADVTDVGVTGFASIEVRLALPVPSQLRYEIGAIDRAEP